MTRLFGFFWLLLCAPALFAVSYRLQIEVDGEEFLLPRPGYDGKTTNDTLYVEEGEHKHVYVSGNYLFYGGVAPRVPFIDNMDARDFVFRLQIRRGEDWNTVRELAVTAGGFAEPVEELPEFDTTGLSEEEIEELKALPPPPKLGREFVYRVRDSKVSIKRLEYRGPKAQQLSHLQIVFGSGDDSY